MYHLSDLSCGATWDQRMLEHFASQTLATPQFNTPARPNKSLIRACIVTCPARGFEITDTNHRIDSEMAACESSWQSLAAVRSPLNSILFEVMDGTGADGSDHYSEAGMAS